MKGVAQGKKEQNEASLVVAVVHQMLGKGKPVVTLT